MSLCRSCDAPIKWAKTRAGKTIPVDAEPSADGNLVLVPDFLGGLFALAADSDPDKPRHKSHFATCPNADAHRKAKR
jgi:hypothetical protein